MHQVRFLERDTVVSVPPGTTILEAARDGGLVLESPCNQTGVCGKCRVRLATDSLSRVALQEQTTISPDKMAEGWVLACHTAISGNIDVLEMIETKRDNTAVLQYGHSAEFVHQPRIRKEFDADNNQTLIYADTSCIGRERGDTSDRLYGVAVDIGTTTVVASLVNLITGSECATVSGHNPQSRYAQDVLSRISFAGRGEGLHILQRAFSSALNTMLIELCSKETISTDQIYELVFSGNTCMLHLATGTAPDSLGQYPYTPLIHGHQSMAATEVGITASPLARIYLPPILSAYVGADITSGILSLQMHQLSGITLLIDIGTNGEIVLARDGQLTATSTAAGPALEGMNISCGMCAGPGAVEQVSATNDRTLTFKTIDDAPAKGFCGSGLIDLVATLLDLGVIEANGRFAKSESLPEELGTMLKKHGGKMSFHLTPDVTLSQKDVRQVQLAKGAIRAGIDQLLQCTDTPPGKVDRVMIAGAFGFHLSTDSLLTLKILPAEFADKVDYVGNTSKTGGHAFLTSTPCRQEMAQLAEQVKILELSGEEDFERHFVRCLRF